MDLWHVETVAGGFSLMNTSMLLDATIAPLRGTISDPDAIS